jgi:hypothetical protein
MKMDTTDPAFLKPSDSIASAYSLAVLLLVGSRRLRGLPVLVHEASRRVWGLRLRRTEQELARSLPPMLPSAKAKASAS